MIKTIDVECNAANPNLPLKPMFAFVNSPSSIRVRNVPKRIGDWCIRKVYFTAVYPDSTVKTAECVLTGGVWVGTIEGTNTSGTSTNGYTIFADGTDENGNNVTGYVLGKGDIEILEADGTLSPDPARYTVKLLSAEATQPREGDMYPTDDGYVIWQDGEAHLLGTPFEQISAYVESAVSAKADLSAIHGDYIEDATGNKICADRTVEIVEQGTPFWNLVDGDSNEYQMTGTKINSKWESASEKYELWMPNPESDGWTLKYYTKLGPTWVTKWNETILEPQSATTLEFPTHGFTATWDDARTVTEGELALKSDLPTKTSDLTNDSGFITSADVPTKTSDLTNDSGFITSDEVLPFHSVVAPTVNTGLAYKAYKLSLNDGATDGQPLADSSFVATYQAALDLTDVFKAGFNFRTYWPYVLTQFNGQTYDPSLELKLCNARLAFLRQGRPRVVYTGWMFRTGGAGFAIPCSEDGTPAGTLYETTGAQANYVLVSSETPHTIGFTSYGDDPYGHITSLDGQEGTIAASRATKLKTKTIMEEVANISDLPTKTSDLTNDSGFITSSALPTKTSDLTNDSGFITSADIITKRDLNDFNVYVDPMADMTTTKFTVVVSYAGDPSTPLFTAELTHQGGEATTWASSPSGSNQRISIDYYSNTDSYHLSYINLQDGGGNEHSGSMNLPLTSPYWMGEAQDDWFHFSATSQTTTIATKEYVDSLIAQLSALEARIAALEGN